MTTSKPTILYHFTAAHCIAKIKAMGLTKGALPWNRAKDGTPQLMRNRLGPNIPGPGFQWLTKNPDFAQPFCFLGELPFAKNTFRITIRIPDKALGMLHSWPEMAAKCRPDSATEINTPAVDWQNWFVFYGRIDPAWFLEVARNPGEAITAAFQGAG